MNSLQPGLLSFSKVTEPVKGKRTWSHNGLKIIVLYKKEMQGIYKSSHPTPNLVVKRSLTSSLLDFRQHELAQWPGTNLEAEQELSV